MRAGEAYTLAAPDPLFGDRQPARIEVYRMSPAAAQVRCIAVGAPIPCPQASPHDWWCFCPLKDSRTPPGWQLTGLASPIGRLWDDREVWRVPGPPWGRELCWAGPAHPLVEHGECPRPGWLGPEIGPVTGPCRTFADAQAAADAWWLAEVDADIRRPGRGGQPSLFS